MFERYAPIQRKIKPSIWKNVIENAILRAKSGETAMDDVHPVLPNGAIQLNSRESRKTSVLKSTDTDESQGSNDCQDCHDSSDSQYLQDMQDSQSAPRSMKYWREHHPKRYERLQRVKAELNQISEYTHTPAEIIIKPQIIRNLCWHDDAQDIDVKTFLSEHGAREWQTRLVAESVTRAIM